ncbi:hypothetical protein JNUCC42_13205 [Brevibacterium sp. JNUCC-42]|nr:hypothetical protein JNUCC42_13205 [Brevibacterium sp. JNUCC-42]
MAISKEEARKRALKNWSMWRILLSDMNITYSELDKMHQDDLAEANAALDIHIEAIDKKLKEQEKRP